MNQNIQAIHQETGKNRLFLPCDMVWCTLRYGVGYLDYHVFGFARNRGANRKTFMTMNHNVSLARMVNDAAYYPCSTTSSSFCSGMGPSRGRRWLTRGRQGLRSWPSFARTGCGVTSPTANLGARGRAAGARPDTDLRPCTGGLQRTVSFWWRKPSGSIRRSPACVPKASTPCGW
ncbi:MAG: hypothetical protein ACLSHU_02035 [Oscillospiraceae bacterium]